LYLVYALIGQDEFERHQINHQHQQNLASTSDSNSNEHQIVEQVERAQNTENTENKDSIPIPDMIPNQLTSDEQYKNKSDLSSQDSLSSIHYPIVIDEQKQNEHGKK
jgi:hypothetical protein